MSGPHGPRLTRAVAASILLTKYACGGGAWRGLHWYGSRVWPRHHTGLELVPVEGVYVICEALELRAQPQVVRAQPLIHYSNTGGSPLLGDRQGAGFRVARWDYRPAYKEGNRTRLDCIGTVCTARTLLRSSPSMSIPLLIILALLLKMSSFFANSCKSVHAGEYFDHGTSLMYLSLPRILHIGCIMTACAIHSVPAAAMTQGPVC